MVLLTLCGFPAFCSSSRPSSSTTNPGDSLVDDHSTLPTKDLSSALLINTMSPNDERAVSAGVALGSHEVYLYDRVDTDSSLTVII